MVIESCWCRGGQADITYIFVWFIA